jgi:hypothetical protein
MTYFVTVKKQYNTLENIKVGGYKDKARAFAAFRKYATGKIQVYAGNGLEVIATRIKGKEYVVSV